MRQDKASYIAVLLDGTDIAWLLHRPGAGVRSQVFSGERPVETRQLLAVDAGVFRFGASNVAQSPSPSGLGGGPAMLSGSTIAATRRRCR